ADGPAGARETWSIVSGPGKVWTMVMVPSAVGPCWRPSCANTLTGRTAWTLPHRFELGDGKLVPTHVRRSCDAGSGARALKYREAPASGAHVTKMASPSSSPASTVIDTPEAPSWTTKAGGSTPGAARFR